MRELIIVGLVVQVVCLVQAAEGRYELTDLGGFFPWAITQDGAMAGQLCESSLQACQPALRQPDGTITVLLEEPGNAYAINAGWQILVELYNRPEPMSLGVWDATNGYVPLPLSPGAIGLFPSALNDAGMVVGLLHLRDRTCPSKWETPMSQPVCLYDAAPGEIPTAWAINSAGDIVGDGDPTKCLWAGGQPPCQPLGFDPSEYAIDINDRGLILGFDGTLQQGTDLASRQTLTLPPRCVDPLTVRLNDAGQVVGRARCFGRDFALVWVTPDHPNHLTLLARNPQWALEHAVDINNSGQIIGYARVRANGYHGFLLQPVGASIAAAD
jgi:hypothetical protein